MGIDIYIFSETNKDLFTKPDPNRYGKWAWRDIDWKEICDLLDIPLTSNWYDNPNDYFCPEDVKDFRDRICKFVSSGSEQLHDDAVKLLEFFDYYVANKVSMRLI